MREVRREASTGARAGWVLSPEKGELECRRCQAKAERKAKRTESQARDSGRLRGVADPVSPAAMRKRRAGEGTYKGTSLMYGAGKSDRRLVPDKAPNKDRGTASKGLQGVR